MMPAMMMAFTGASIEEAIQMASVNQAIEFGLTNKGTLTIGKDADLNVFSADLTSLKQLIVWVVTSQRLTLRAAEDYMGAPVYIQIHDEISEAIEAGRWVPGDKIPAERELAEQFGVSRMTLRQAVMMLGG